MDAYLFDIDKFFDEALRLSKGEDSDQEDE